MRVYNFRPGFMKPATGQKNVKTYYKLSVRPIHCLTGFFLNQVSTMQQVGKAMINSVFKGYNQRILEIKDIKPLAGQ